MGGRGVYAESEGEAKLSENEGTWAALTRSEYPLLRSNVTDAPGTPLVLTEELMVRGFETMKALAEARRERDRDQAPLMLEIGKRASRLIQVGREDDAYRLMYLGCHIQQWECISMTASDWLTAILSEEL